MKNASILIVDDEKNYLELMKSLLQEEGYQYIITESDPLKVENILRNEQVDVILLDVYMPGMNGLELLENLIPLYPQIPFIMVTGVDDVQIALKAIKLGAYEFITKPPEIDRLSLTIKRALEQKLLERERDTLRKGVDRSEASNEKFREIISESPAILKVFELIEIFAPTNETVLITGETGTGKDLIARKIHQLSPRKNKSFVTVNLASISPTLFESELFGHERGSFTGATSERLGYFEAANGGTIFLDEIGEMPRELQGKLLRAIQYNEIYRIGSTKPLKLDIRIITATNKDLLEAVNDKEFRADLYYRLNRGYIKLPPLRDRGEDIIILSKHFLEMGNKTYSKKAKGFSIKAMNKLKSYSFPGNIRELENLVLNAVAKTKDNELITEIDIPDGYNREVKIMPMENNLITIDDLVKNHILQIIKHADGNVQRAALILGVSERTLQRRLQKIRENGR
ncbi:MAG TPA: sigma-54 dependent transcriptional regulator [Ignavibacteriaceae bacterium]|nr:sigma-54 dependent transcriptional regulator [Ignavibacteriaceae bacterium]